MKESARFEFAASGNFLGSHYASFSRVAEIAASLESNISIGNSILAARYLSPPAYLRNLDVFSTSSAMTKSFEAARQMIQTFSRVGEIAASFQSTVSIGNSNLVSKYRSAYFQQLVVYPTFDAVTKSFQAMRQMIEPFQSARNLMEGFLRYEETITKNAERLGSLGWTIPMDATIPEIIRLVEQSSNSEAADEAFTDFYNAEERAMYLALKERLLFQAELALWREDLSTAFTRFEDSDYRSCVNNLLPVVDGFASEHLNEPRFYSQRARERFFVSKLIGTSGLPIGDALWRSVKAFLDGLFEPVDFADEARLNKRLNRHARLHGRGKYKPTQADCLRLLQALDTLFSCE